MNLFTLIILVGSVASASSSHLCSGPLHSVIVTDQSIQFFDQPAMPAIRSVGIVDTYRSLDGQVSIEIANPAFSGAHCKIQDSPLPHGDHEAICQGILLMQNNSSEEMICR